MEAGDVKILIAGALGYDGSGLIDSYRDNKEDDIILLDKRFVPHILANLPPRFRFVEGNILDKELMRHLLPGVDLVYLLAGEVEAEKSINKQRDIWENNYDGAVNVIEACSDHAHILFASSGNVFGGVLETEKNTDLTEEDEPRPKYPYAESKRAVEQYLLKSRKRYTIMRFGTHYGYTPGIRFNLVTNTFMKRAMMGQNITVHGSGDNYRPTLCALDAIRGMRFLAMNPKAVGQIFHLVGNNYRIREIAAEVAAACPGIQVEHILKEVPFNSYHLSSEKIKRLGFEFRWDIGKGIQHMKGVFASLQRRG
jgi:nucleoside-diphosphate-sugar epimerase